MIFKYYFFFLNDIMEIEIDYCPTSEREHYFVSVGLNENEAISFDHTLKGCRIIKQILIKDNLNKKLLYYSRLICDNYLNLDKFSDEIIKFEKILYNEIKNLK